MAELRNEDAGRNHRRGTIGITPVPALDLQGIETVVLEKHSS